MAKAYKKQNKIDLENLSDRDKDILTLDVKDTMKKYKAERQGVYDRRFALNKKIKAAGLTVEDLLNPKQAAKKGGPKAEAAPNTKAAAKKGRPKKAAAVEPVSESRELMVMPEQQVPVVMKPIEINFDNFSIKLNGVPKRISVNPDTNAIEIDL